MAECIDVTVHAEEWFIDELKSSTKRRLEWEWVLSDGEIRDG